MPNGATITAGDTTHGRPGLYKQSQFSTIIKWLNFIVFFLSWLGGVCDLCQFEPNVCKSTPRCTVYITSNFETIMWVLLKSFPSHCLSGEYPAGKTKFCCFCGAYFRRLYNLNDICMFPVDNNRLWIHEFIELRCPRITKCTTNISARAYL